MELGLKGKRALVLAASRGLGYACALGLAREGCDLVICSRDEGRIGAAAERIRAETGARVKAVAVDVASEQAARDLVAACVAEYGGLEIAVHNAGGPPAAEFMDIPSEQWQKSFEQNLMSYVWMVQAAVPAMREAGYGRILAITSISVKQPIPELILSNTFRTGVLGLSRTLAQKLARDNILVHLIAPGRIGTERIVELDTARAARSGKTPEEVTRSYEEKIPLGRLGRPEELANLAVFLASEAASYLTGTVTQVDGGMLDALQ
jgi:3-oxoacyl-[acyl-carrier protein] reductase